MSRTAWRFVDPVTEDVYSLPVNPHTDAGSHAYNRSSAWESGSGLRRTEGGFDTIDNIIFEANIEQETFSYEGRVYDQAQYDEMLSWMEKGYAFQLYDDLGRGFLIYPTDYSLNRVRSRQNTYKHTYSFNGIILEELTTAPVISFSYGPYTGSAPLSVDFLDESVDYDGYISSRVWNFGDGNFSAELNPTHVYTVPGNYTITLTVFDNEGHYSQLTDSLGIEVL